MWAVAETKVWGYNNKNSYEIGDTKCELGINDRDKGQLYESGSYKVQPRITTAVVRFA